MTHKLFRIGVLMALFLLWLVPVPNQLMAQEDLGINKIVVCEDVVDRTPVSPGTEFGVDVEKLFCFTPVKNPGPKTTITHVWTHEGEVRSQVDMTVGTSPNWRTWSKKTIEPEWTGAWTVTVLDEAGAELAKTDFWVKSMEAEEPMMGIEEEMEPSEEGEEMEEEPAEMMTKEEMETMEPVEPMEPMEEAEMMEEEEMMETEEEMMETEEEMMPMEEAPEDTMTQDDSGR